MKNYELLGIDANNPEEFADRLRELDAERRDAEECPRWTYRRSYILTLLEYPCWEQMGYIEISDLPQRLEDGCKAVIDYFHGDWWREENIRRIERETPELLRIKPWSTVENIIENNAQRMDRSNPDCMFQWYEPLRSGIIFGGLLEKWDDVAHICSALDADVAPEYSAGTIIDEYFHYYLCVAGKLSGQWDAGFEKLLESAKKCRQKRLRDLLAAWDAAVASDQAAFDKAFPAAIKSFIKRKDDPSEHMGAALDETVIWLIAKRAGLSFPELSDKLNAAVMTCKSLGLDTTP
ncbi:hypothetical protein Mal52_61780 [Symmachiella dynata]|uniref:Uncharacterized protein n=1 Tax=Symmachiella dynata TaxID=2527995 RepID=A0A517ZYX3_9PLAN|nr:hypothetical protein [Symmachiella dynata]QDU47643.1 hypothetical protein Mal52_61780 [Symmachiella dynata]